MLDVLEPFEIADGHTAAVAEHIRQEAHSLFEQDLLALESGGAVGCLYDELALKPVGIVDVDGLFEGSWDEDIAE